MSQRSKVQPSSGTGGLSELADSETPGLMVKDPQRPHLNSWMPAPLPCQKNQRNPNRAILCSYLPRGHFGKVLPSEKEGIPTQEEGREEKWKKKTREGGKEKGKEGGREGEHRKNGIKLLVSGLVCKELGSHHSHSYKTRAEQTENQ